MPNHPLELIGANDHELLEAIKQAEDLALTDGALSAKHKLLIAMALDASKGTSEGVRNLARQAMQHGATRAEIMDTLRVVNHICGVGSMYTAAAALREIW